MFKQNEVEGAGKQIEGKIKDKVGELINNSELEAEGEAERAEGKVQQTVGKVVRKVEEAIEK